MVKTFGNEDTIKWLKETFTPGTRIRCIAMYDKYPVPVGTEGTVRHVDDIGTIHVNWDNGSGLGLVYGEDRFEVIV